MKASVLRYADLPPDLIDRWTEFCSQGTVYESPFYSPHFTRAVAAVREDARVAVYERGGDVIGFLPFHLTRSGIGKPIGGQLNDYQGPILARGTSLSAAELLNGADIASYDYNHLPTSFASLANGAHSFSSSPQMDLSEGYDACIASKGSSWKRAAKLMRRRHRKTEQEFGPVRFTFHDPDDATYQQHLAMKNALLQRVGTRFRIDENWVGKILERIRKTQIDEFAGVMTTLHAGDRLIAAHFGMRSSSTWHYWFSSYDLETSKLGPGINLVNHCAEAAPSHGLGKIDFGRGDADYKLLFADRQIELCEGAVARPGSLAKLVRQGAQSLVSATERLPLGRYGSYPRRAAAKFISGVAL